MKPAFEILEGSQHTEVANLFPAWQQLVGVQKNHYLLYQSPEWWAHLHTTGRGGSAILIKLIEDGSLVGIIPLLAKQEPFWLLPVKTPLTRVSMTYVEMLGGQPLIPADEVRAAQLFEFIFSRFKNIQALYFKSVSQTSDWYELLIRGARNAKGCFSYIQREETFHFLTLPGTFDEFLRRFTKKKRYNLKRQLRLMEEAYQGKLSLECISTADRVDAFLEASSAVASVSWKEDKLTRALARSEANQARYSDLANRGLLRAYVLRDDQRPVAYALGYQYGGTYHYSDISYAESEWRLSPGTVLLFLIVQDLIERSSLRQVNFGISDADYKRQFADQHTRDRSIWIFRSTSRNYLASLVQSSSWKVARFAKSVRDRFSAGRESTATG